MKSKTIKIHDNEKKCKEVVLILYRDDEGEDGVLISGWYEEENEPLIACRFIKMELEDGESFIRDFSSLSADDFIYNMSN